MSWFYSTGKEPQSEVKVYDLVTHQITTIPGSKDLDSARWSPDGQWLSGLNIDTTELLVFNFKTQRWTSVEKGNNDYPNWSHHGGFLYFLHGDVDTGIFRVKPTGGAAERVVDLTGFRFTSYYNGPEWPRPRRCAHGVARRRRRRYLFSGLRTEFSAASLSLQRWPQDAVAPAV